jgi:hypothetical protein
LWSSFQWIIAVCNERFSQSLLALLLSHPSLPITLSVAHVTAGLFALPSTMCTINGTQYAMVYCVPFKLLASQQHFLWAVWVIMGSLRNFPADYHNNLNCYRIQSTLLHQYQQCMVRQFQHHQHILKLSSVPSVPTPTVLTTVIIKQQVPENTG